MTQLILSGCGGRMGHAIRALVDQDPACTICAGFDPIADPAAPFPVFASPMEYNGTADCLIDFSSSAALDDLLRFALAGGIPVVLATTGYSDAQLEQIRLASERIPVFRSANFSIGVNVMASLIRQAAAALAGYDIEVVEMHHNQKVDAPSGTALLLADAASEGRERTYVYDRTQRRQKRPAGEIGISSLRGGTVVGEHAVLFAGHDEVLELRHSAQSRELFAVGALRAAKYLAGVKEPGLYDMQRMLADQGL